MQVPVCARTDNDVSDSLQAPLLTCAAAGSESDHVEVEDAAVNVHLLVLGVGLGELGSLEGGEEAAAPE